jgi:hypothetical protein
MGIGLPAGNLYADLYQSDYFKDRNSVIELGAQQLMFEPQELLNLLNAIGLIKKDEFGRYLTLLEDYPSATPTKHILRNKGLYAPFLYKQFGVEEYASIDTNGHFNALPYDLNKDVQKEYGHTKTYDVVSNHGTAEHVFDLHQVFRNVHNLAHNGSLIIHGAPFQGYVNHGFYNFQPQFFEDLAAANQYKIVRRYLALDLEARELVPLSETILSHLDVPQRDVYLFYVFIKTNDEEFKIPFNRTYYIPEQFDEYHRQLTSSGGAINFYDRSKVLLNEISPREAFQLFKVKVLNSHPRSLKGRVARALLKCFPK